MATRSMTLANQKATEALAGQLAKLTSPPCTLCLDGPLGVGKSVFARAFLRAYGITGDIPSPTFTLVQTYSVADITLWHVDAYRLETPDEALQFGLLDAFDHAIVLLEWPGKIAQVLPDDRIDIFIQRGQEGHQRVIDFVSDAFDLSAL
ncbi:MAG: tRNA (adenosine(37)-N6)-threonylcarbamoyltransferase complex ATPase subunit type 1 TsaE [Pseudomonadota bacterium]